MDDEADDFESLDGMRQRLHEQYIATDKLAEIEAEKIDWPNNKTPLKETLSNLGGKIANEYYYSVGKGLMSNDGIMKTEIPPCIHAQAMFAERLLWIAERQASISNNSFISCFGHTSGAFFNYLDNLSNEGAKPIPNFDKWYQPMEAISLVFFNQADVLMQNGQIVEALDKVAEAFLAKGLHDYMLWLEIGGEDKKSSQAKKGAAAKLKNDPTQKEKAIVFEWWQDWQKSKTTENPKGNYCGKAEFARDMIKDLEHTKDVRTITESWCPEWEKSHPAS